MTTTDYPETRLNSMHQHSLRQPDAAQKVGKARVRAQAVVTRLHLQILQLKVVRGVGSLEGGKCLLIVTQPGVENCQLSLRDVIFRRLYFLKYRERFIFFV